MATTNVGLHSPLVEVRPSSVHISGNEKTILKIISGDIVRAMLLFYWLVRTEVVVQI